MPLHILVNTQRRCSLATQRLNLLPVRFEEMENLNGCVRCLTRRSLRAFQKKLEPFFPNSFRAHPLKQIIVALPMSLEVKTQVEQRLTQSTFGAEKQSDEQTAQPTIAIEKGVDGLELYVDETCLYENRQLVFFVVKKM